MLCKNSVAQKVVQYLLKFQRADGSFPLVLREGEKGYPRKIDTMDERFLGWYSYNNLFDYLPFLGYFLMKAYLVCTSENTKNAVHIKFEQNRENIYQDKNFLVYFNTSYTAVVGRPGGRWTNDMPFPYVCYKGVSVFPCYGGQQQGDTLYTADASTPIDEIKERTRLGSIKQLQNNARKEV